MKEVLSKISSLLNFRIHFSEFITISVKHIIVLITILICAKYLLSTFQRIINERLDDNNKDKFDTVFSFAKWFAYILIFLITLNAIGVNLNALFASAAALLIGIGLALQTWFQDIMAGVFIIFDKSLKIGDVIEINNKIGRIQEIRLRTTRAVTLENKVLIIPNHLYLTSSLYNWTQNSKEIRASVAIGVSYESDVELVKQLLLQAANEHPLVLKDPKAIVLFEDFGDNALLFKVVFWLADGFTSVVPQSDVRFRINQLFKEHNIKIPFPQRDVHLIKN